MNLLLKVTYSLLSFHRVWAWDTISWTWPNCWSSGLWAKGLMINKHTRGRSNTHPAKIFRPRLWTQQNLTLRQCSRPQLKIMTLIIAESLRQWLFCIKTMSNRYLMHRDNEWRHQGENERRKLFEVESHPISWNGRRSCSSTNNKNPPGSAVLQKG